MLHKNRIHCDILCIYYDKYFRTKHTKEETLEKVTHSGLDDNDDDCNDHLKIYEEDLYLSDVSEKLDDLASGTFNSKIDKQPNVSYNLFTIGPMESPKHERIKHGVKEYRMLVRTKTDCIEVRIFLIVLINNHY